MESVLYVRHKPYVVGDELPDSSIIADGFLWLPVCAVLASSQGIQAVGPMGQEELGLFMTEPGRRGHFMLKVQGSQFGVLV